MCEHPSENSEGISRKCNGAKMKIKRRRTVMKGQETMTKGKGMMMKQHWRVQSDEQPSVAVQCG